MGLLPEFAVAEKDGRVLVGHAPDVREHTSKFLALLAIIGGPTAAVVSWLTEAVPDMGAVAIAGLGLAAGRWLMQRATEVEFVLDEQSALIIVDPRADAVTCEGRRLCAASDVAAVEMRSGPKVYHQLFLRTRGVLMEPGTSTAAILTGFADHVEEPGRRIASCLGVPFERV